VNPTLHQCAHCENRLPDEAGRFVRQAVEISCCDECPEALRKQGPDGAIWLCWTDTDQGDRDARVEVPTEAQARLAILGRQAEAAADQLQVVVAAMEETENRDAYLQCFMGGTATEAQFTFNRLVEKSPVVVVELRQLASLYARLAGRRSERPVPAPSSSPAPADEE